ncbi:MULTISPECIES: diguanylate cyclase [unclassified Pseudodesulfovibrio]|uniref:GGDEF domain-containing response regulator n=1 Tax=unclassified Pseudodesulfovibrio TaxID=2661612 RepID=UPI000FEC1867|nr:MULTISPECIES: diguanylate cyclase [unclassified Pseudodesulfovibrio]MCJ2163297.1 diguanylate cyclase [Pseudodesulfovibrio sp. S3-i]RWU07276.1 diguanylate cyclase [Pseudodesulfovibrio sp. S3]
MNKTLEESLFQRKQTGFLLSPDKFLAEMLQTLWSPDVMEFTVFTQGAKAIEHMFNEPPDLLVVDNRLKDITGQEVANLVKSENVYRQLPVVMCVDPIDVEEPWNWNQVEVDDFLVRPFNPAEVRDRINLTLCRAMRALDANPLSKLPGNTSIIQRIQQLIDNGDDFALAYCDLDYFKSYNDKYGFSRGDEILMMSARLIVNTIRSYQGVQSFVGHVGGDDFVFILPPDKVEDACKRIIAAFDDIVPHFYDPDDRKRGNITSIDREGNTKVFPLMAISLAVVVNTGKQIQHYGEVSSIAMELKKKAKEDPKSSYVIDQRKA